MRKNNNFYKDLFYRVVIAKTLILSYKALSFIKPEFVNDVFYRLKEDVDDINEALLIDFIFWKRIYNKFWIWKMELLFKKNLTNIACEGYNSKLMRLMDYKRPTFWHNIEIILNEI